MFIDNLWKQDFYINIDGWPQYSLACVKSIQIQSFFWLVFSCIRTEYRDLLRKSPYSGRIQGNTDQKKLCIWTLFIHAVSKLPEMFNSIIMVCSSMLRVSKWFHWNSDYHDPHIPPGNPHLSSTLQFSDNQNLVRADPDCLHRKLTAFSCKLLLPIASS